MVAQRTFVVKHLLYKDIIEATVCPKILFTSPSSINVGAFFLVKY